MNKLLVLAFHYPPDNSSTGVLRTSKFTAYLVDHDWVSHVISAPERLYASRNPRGAIDIPAQVKVERVWGCDVRKAFGIRGAYPAWLAFPDRFWPWFFAARSAGIRAIRGGIDVIYSTYPLPTAHLVALSLKARYRVPWVADFRDPWATVEENGWAARMERRLERLVIAAADRVICNTPAMRRDFLARYGDAAPEKFVTIPNGYDEKDFSRIVPVAEAKFQLFYPGSIDAENRNPKGLFAGIRLALERQWLDADDFLLTFLGAGAYADSAAFGRDLDTYGLRQYVRVVRERVSYAEALARAAGADVMVVLSESLEEKGAAESWTKMQVPAKVYEYLRLGRPLLALVGEGAVRELLQDKGRATVVSGRNSEEVAQALRRLYEARTTAATPSPASTAGPDAAVRAYSRENLTMMLARELDALLPQAALRRGAGATCVPTP